jgi:hypothetical protein
MMDSLAMSKKHMVIRLAYDGQSGHE